MKVFHESCCVRCRVTWHYRSAHQLGAREILPTQRNFSRGSCLGGLLRRACSTPLLLLMLLIGFKWEWFMYVSLYVCVCVWVGVCLFSLPSTLPSYVTARGASAIGIISFFVSPMCATLRLGHALIHFFAA